MRQTLEVINTHDPHPKIQSDNKKSPLSKILKIKGFFFISIIRLLFDQFVDMNTLF